MKVNIGYKYKKIYNIAKSNDGLDWQFEEETDRYRHYVLSRDPNFQKIITYHDKEKTKISHIYYITNPKWSKTNPDDLIEFTHQAPPELGKIPTQIVFQENGNIKMESYIAGTTMHSSLDSEEGHPTIIHYDKNGNIESEVYYKYNRHEKTIHYKPNGETEIEY